MRVNDLKHLDIIVRAYTLYEIILKQFQTNSFYKITDETIKHDYEINIKKFAKQTQARQPVDFFSLDVNDTLEEQPEIYESYGFPNGELRSDAYRSLSSRAPSNRQQVRHQTEFFNIGDDTPSESVNRIEGFRSLPSESLHRSEGFRSLPSESLHRSEGFRKFTK